jgi:prepilin-type N-terminal cleavage/methylation domain-containing protein
MAAPPALASAEWTLQLQGRAPIMSRDSTRTPPNHDRRFVESRLGFTLIELLVVVAIISLLVAILLPSLAKAKELAKQAVCMSNLKNFGLAMHMYTGENDGFFPSSGGFESGQSPTTPYYYTNNWMYVLAPYLDGNTRVYNCWYNTPAGSIWTCPSDEKTSRDGDGDLLQPSYGANRWITGWYDSEYTGGHVGPYRIDEIDVQQDRLPLMSDNDSPWGCTPNHVVDSYGPGMHPWPHFHNVGDDFLFVEGHVEWIPKLESDGDGAWSIYWTYREASKYFAECDWWR